MRIYHLSDLHYGRRDPNRSAHYFTDPQRRTPNPETLANVLVATATQRPPDAIVVSGDVGWTGAAEDYDFAFTFLNTLRDRLGVPIVIAPGNHDVDWNATSDPARQDAFVGLLQRFYGANFATLYPRYDGASDRRRHDLSSLHRIGRATIVTVNSAATEGPEGPKCGMCNNLKYPPPPILVDPTALTSWEEELRRREDDLRILVVHHHLLPFKEMPRNETTDPATPEDKPDDTIIANSARVQAWLAANKFSIVFHGHKHRAHVRHDILATRNDDQIRDILILGAGSAGVHEDERSPEDPLTFYVVEARPLRTAVFSIGVDTYRIDTPALGPRATLDNPRMTREVGARSLDAPSVFHAGNVPDCYEAIAASARSGLVIKNFVSIVDDAAFALPPEAKLRGQAVTEAMVRKSFLTLHPEYDPTSGWTNPALVRERLATQPQRFRFQHGNRLFAIPASVTPKGPTHFVDPFELAIRKVGSGSSRAYVGLYNAFVDGHEGKPKQPPPPCLVGIQFVLDSTNSLLNLVATFRKIELSFWWLVNMYEMHLILRHAVHSQPAGSRPRLGSITFYATLAEWKGADPGPTFSAALDEFSVSEVVRLAIAATQGNNAELKSLLTEKLEITNDDNIDERGLTLLADTLEAFVRSASGGLRTDFVEEIRRAADQLSTARDTEGAAATLHEVSVANDSLRRAIAML